MALQLDSRSLRRGGIALTVLSIQYALLAQWRGSGVTGLRAEAWH